jgi:hypothetical protein
VWFDSNGLKRNFDADAQAMTPPTEVRLPESFNPDPEANWAHEQSFATAVNG